MKIRTKPKQYVNQPFAKQSKTEMKILQIILEVKSKSEIVSKISLAEEIHAEV